MNAGELFRKTERAAIDNAPTILTALGVSGTIATAYLTAKASFKAAEQINADFAWHEPLKVKAKRYWKFYIPPVASGAFTIVCIIGATRASTKKTAAAYSLLTVSEKAFTEYKEKVVEQIGTKKEQTIRDEIAQDRVNKQPQGLVMVGTGSVLCYEQHSGRYFNSDMETLRRAVNEVNAKMIRENSASLSDFYYLVGLPPTQFSDRSGWSSSKMLELRFSTVMSEDSRPCIAFEYNYIEPF